MPLMFLCLKFSLLSCSILKHHLVLPAVNLGLERIRPTCQARTVVCFHLASVFISSVQQVPRCYGDALAWKFYTRADGPHRRDSSTTDEASDPNW